VAQNLQSSRRIMENMQYAEELLREFFVFRGFTNTIQAFETELTTDIGRNFQVDKILDLIFEVYVPRYQADKLVSLLNFSKQYFYSPSDVVLFSTLLKLELSVLRYYVVHALQSGRQDKVVEFSVKMATICCRNVRIGRYGLVGLVICSS